MSYFLPHALDYENDVIPLPLQEESPLNSHRHFILFSLW